MRRKQTRGEMSYINGLSEALSKGMAAAEDPTISEADCPYKRFEHRKSWLEGFRSVRNKAGGRQQWA